MVKVKREAPPQGLNEARPPENTGWKQDGRFREGASGNPNGRPPGARNHATRLAEAMLEDETGALVRQAIDLAKAGDMAAIRFCLEASGSPPHRATDRF
jgi:hypothetical protein